MKNSSPKESSKFCIKSKQTSIRATFEGSKIIPKIFPTNNTTDNSDTKICQPITSKSKTILIWKKPIGIEYKQVELNKSGINDKFKSEISKNGMINFYWKDDKNNNIQKERNLNLMKQNNKEICGEKVPKIRNNKNSCNSTTSIASAFISHTNIPNTKSSTHTTMSNIKSNAHAIKSNINKNDDVVPNTLAKVPPILLKKKTSDNEGNNSSSNDNNACDEKQNKDGKLILKMKSYNSGNNKNECLKKNCNTNIKSVDDIGNANSNNSHINEKENKPFDDNLYNENYIKMEELLKDYNEAVKNKKDTEFDINVFIERYDIIIDGLFKLDNIEKCEIKKSIIKKYKQLFENNNAMKFYKGIKTLVYEKNIIIQYMEYYKKQNKQYAQDLKEIQDSNDMLITQIKQLNQNNIMLKKLVNILCIDRDTKKNDLST
ncbi:hypothetical protein YYG_00896 [Plasmodium vinckei petteri]|uniref:Uncharacterized protein n=1 Tax=Plasmodium vinckei petteri TaxID=138298 RepID=W7B736_PLAVN|nr:hypothetical protein YYG_00896 [Plasmodium vinckei petteri]CAD2106920.1 conserved Plasmodium protein, unknown function [Plasmodium vinckei petteri]